jgi:PKD repeat protein
MKTLQHVLSHLLRNRNAQPRQPRRSLLRLEAMEDRLLPTVSPVNVVIDNSNAALFSTTGTWTQATGGYGGTFLYQNTDATATATWQKTGLSPGFYDVQLTWAWGANRSNAASYQVLDGTNPLTTVTVNQQAPPQGGTPTGGKSFQDEGLFLVESGTLKVVLQGSSTATVIADAVHIVSSTGIHGLPRASFTGPASVYEGTTLAKVSFGSMTGGSLGYRYSYDFGNTGNFEIAGSTSYYAKVPESYVDDGPGTLVVHGRITDSIGDTADYLTDINLVNVAPTPKITRFAVMDVGVAAPLTASASDPSTADIAAGINYTWNFGDGSTGTGANVSHAYSHTGTFTVTLTATDKDGGTKSKTASVKVVPLPTATFTAPATVNEGSTTSRLVFTNATGGSGGYTYSYLVINNGNNFSLSLSNNSPNVLIPERVVDDGPTTIDVIAQIKDTAGGFTDYTGTITVNDVAPTPKITLPAGVDIGVPATFKATATTPSSVDNLAGYSYSWTYTNGHGDTGSSNLANPSFTFNATGTYLVTLTATDADGGLLTGTTSKLITVSPLPVAVFSGPVSVTAGTTTAHATFSSPGLGTGGYKYSFDFNNDGKFEVTNSTTATAVIPESYLDVVGSTATIHGRITDSAGGSNDYTFQTSVTEAQPAAAITVPTAIDVGVQTTFHGSATDPSKADTNAGFTYSWTYTNGQGDSGTATGAVPNFTFKSTGAYTVGLTVADTNGGSNSTSKTVTVLGLPTATFSGPVTVNEGATNAVVGFTNAVGGSGGYTYSYDWDNNGSFEVFASKNATATVPEKYLDDGPTTVVVHGRITDSLGGHTDYTFTITVNNVAPTAVWTEPTNVVAGTAATFSASATDPSTADTQAGFTYLWTFSDVSGTFSGDTVNHTFAAPGTYTVTLEVIDQDGGMTTLTDNAFVVN